MMAEDFRRAGWQVYESGTAEDAIALVRTGLPIDIVFTDIQLAGQLTGWDVAEQCREVRESVAIIYASGNAADRTRKVDGSLFFDKPYLPEAVIDACSSVALRSERGLRG